jgi:hypothetical protein
MSTILIINDVLTQMTNRSTATVKFVVSPPDKNGLYTLYRNGALLYKFHLVTHPPSLSGVQTVKSGTGSDANPSGAMLMLTDNNGASARADAVQFINGLK